MKFNLNKFLHAANLVAGPVLSAAGVPPALIPIVQHGLINAEIASEAREKPLTGAEKKLIVMDSLATGIAGVNAVKPGAVDPNVTPLVGHGIDVVIQTINAVNKEPISI